MRDRRAVYTTALLSLPPTRPRTIVYVDGFNLYYGAVRKTLHKWLNLAELCRRLRKDDDLVCIRYFTARVSGRKQMRQLALWKAMSTEPLMKIIQGNFKEKWIECSHPACTYTGDRFFDTREEKRTDVNIAVWMVDDAYQDRCDWLVLISGDSDLVPAVDLIRQRFRQKKIIVYVPTGAGVKDRRADELKKAAGDGRDLPTALLPLCQFPSAVTTAQGEVVKKPETW